MYVRGDNFKLFVGGRGLCDVCIKIIKTLQPTEKMQRLPDYAEGILIIQGVRVTSVSLLD